MLVNVDSRLLRCLGLCGGLLVGKMLLMGPITTITRRKKGIVNANPEDVKFLGGKLDLADPDVERVRRCHRNDMENIYLFFSNASFYLMTEPNVGTAAALFYAFTATRYLHTVAYLAPLPQPSRALSWLSGYGIQVYMAFVTIRHFLRK